MPRPKPSNTHRNREDKPTSQGSSRQVTRTPVVRQVIVVPPGGTFRIIDPPEGSASESESGERPSDLTPELKRLSLETSVGSWTKEVSTAPYTGSSLPTAEEDSLRNPTARSSTRGSSSKSKQPNQTDGPDVKTQFLATFLFSAFGFTVKRGYESDFTGFVRGYAEILQDTAVKMTKDTLPAAREQILAMVIPHVQLEMTELGNVSVMHDKIKMKRGSPYKRLDDVVQARGQLFDTYHQQAKQRYANWVRGIQTYISGLNAREMTAAVSVSTAANQRAIEPSTRSVAESDHVSSDGDSGSESGEDAEEDEATTMTVKAPLAVAPKKVDKKAMLAQLKTNYGAIKAGYKVRLSTICKDYGHALPMPEELDDDDKKNLLKIIQAGQPEGADAKYTEPRLICETWYKAAYQIGHTTCLTKEELAAVVKDYFHAIREALMLLLWDGDEDDIDRVLKIRMMTLQALVSLR